MYVYVYVRACVRVYDSVILLGKNSSEFFFLPETLKLNFSKRCVKLVSNLSPRSLLCSRSQHEPCRAEAISPQKPSVIPDGTA